MTIPTMTSLDLVYFPSAVALGALHALEPGHSKALTASYLIGIKGTKRDSIILGLSVAATHSLVVILISAIGIWLGNTAFTGHATQWLESASGVIAISIGCWMLWRRLFIRKLALNHEHDYHEDHHENEDHDHLDDIAHAKAHAEALPDYVRNGEKPSFGQIVAFGAAGGMIPCPASITVMLLALSSGKAALGILTVFGFSLGLAIALVGIGVIVVSGLSKLSETGRLTWLTRQAPVMSASLVILSGVFALFISNKP
jgi:nickel/cobalt exporter